MTLRPLLISVVLAALAALVSVAVADGAWASPVSGLVPQARPVLHGGVSVGVGVGVPLGPRGHPYRGHPYRGHPYRGQRGFRGHRGGYWAVRHERIWVPGEMIGYDAYGQPIYSAGFWTVRPTRVWVPGPRYYPRGRVSVGVGLGFYR